MTNQEQIDAEELPPELVISILRERIEESKKRVTGARVDIMMLESLPNASASELGMLNSNLAKAREARDAYQAKLDAITGVVRAQIDPA